jgi:hypothetical protein
VLTTYTIAADDALAFQKTVAALAKTRRKLSIHSAHGIGNARLLGDHRAERRWRLSTRAEVLNHLISFFIKFHIAKLQIRFALLGDEWLYIKIQASPFTSCIDEVCWLLRLWLKQDRRCAAPE